MHPCIQILILPLEFTSLIKSAISKKLFPILNSSFNFNNLIKYNKKNTYNIQDQNF